MCEKADAMKWEGPVTEADSVAETRFMAEAEEDLQR